MLSREFLMLLHVKEFYILENNTLAMKQEQKERK